MRVTPLDIRKQEFKKVMRGLDSEEVYAFLNTVAEEYEVVLSDNKNIRERLVALEERLNEYKAIETNLRNTLLTAEKLTHEAKENARREASLMMREAQMEAEKAAESIRAHTAQLRREILELKKNKDNYVTRLKTLIDGHRKMLDGFDEDFAGVDQAIEKIGQQVEEDVSKPAGPPRMSRDKITENFGHEPKDKVTWGDDRRREDEQRPQVPRPGFETRETPDQRTKPEDMNVFEPSGTGQGLSPAAPAQQPQQPAQKGFEQLFIEPLGATVSSPAAPQAHPAPSAPQQSRPAPSTLPQAEAPKPSDDWKQYEVRKQPTDWKSYEIPGQQPAQSPSARRVEEVDVESALSGLKEAVGAAETIPPRRDVNQMPPQAPPQMQAPPQAPAAQPAAAKANPEATWSMEELRRNLSNLTKDERNQG
jgi:cell division initiation protein